MKLRQYLRIVVALAVFLLAEGGLQAQSASATGSMLAAEVAAGVFDPAKKEPITTPRDWVTDKAGVVDTRTKAYLEQRLGDLEKTTGIQFVVYVDRTLNGESIEVFANRNFRAWGVGQKEKDNGIGYFLFTNDRTGRFEVGYGLESVITNEIATNIQAERMRSAFYGQDWNTGLKNGVDAAIVLLEKHAAAKAASGDSVVTEHVIDRASALSRETRLYLDRRLTELEARSGIKFVVFTGGRLPGMSIEDFTLQYFQEHQLGKGANPNAIGYFLFTEDRASRYEVSPDLKPQFSNEYAVELQRQTMGAAIGNGVFGTSEWDTSVRACVDNAIQHFDPAAIAARSTAEPSRRPIVASAKSASIFAGMNFPLVGLALVAGVLVVVLVRSMRSPDISPGLTGGGGHPIHGMPAPFRGTVTFREHHGSSNGNSGYSQGGNYGDGGSSGDDGFTTGLVLGALMSNSADQDNSQGRDDSYCPPSGGDDSRSDADDSGSSNWGGGDTSGDSGGGDSGGFDGGGGDSGGGGGGDTW